MRWLAGVLIAIDITLAGLFWAMAPDEDVLARLIRKTLYIGVFAFIIGNYNNLAQIIYNSFAGLGLEAGGGTLTAAQLLQPGKVAQVGIDAGKPILTSISGLMGFTSFFDNFIQIAILLIAWLIVVISFFIMAIQLFVSLIEFKLTTLAGFVLVPFGLFGRTAFLAEKVLGNVVSSGVKILVLAVIVGIGSTIFGQFTSGFNNPPTINDALTLILAALAMLGLSIFGPGIANGLIAGGPQLGAGAAVGTGLAVAGVGAAGAGVAAAGVGAVGAAGGCRSLARRVAAASSRARPSRPFAPAAWPASPKPPAPPPTSPLRRAAASMRDELRGRSGRAVTGGRAASAAASASCVGGSGSGPPAWARRMKRNQIHQPAASAPPITPSAPAIIRRAAAASTYPKGNDHVPKAHRPLRQDPRARDALSARRPGLGRADRLRPRAGEELAARLLRRARAQRRPRRGPRLAIGARHDHALGRAGRQARRRRRRWRRRPPTIGRPIPRSPGISRASSTKCGAFPADPVVLRQDWLEAYNYVTDKGALALNDYARANDPFSKVGKTQVSVEVASVIRASDDSFRVAWVERRYVDDALASTERWSAILTIVVQTPTDADRLKKNPLGVYVHALNWSKELG